MTPPEMVFTTETQRRDARFANKLARRRRLLLRWSIPVVVLAALVALKLLTAVGLNLIGTASYDRSNFTTAIDRYRNTQVVNVVQPWKAFYNEGTAQYSAGKFFTATKRFDIALDKVPKTPADQPRGEDECMVRVNYSLALEGSADEALAVGNAEEAEAFYTQALEMLDDCADSGQSGEVGEQAQQRQEEGLQDAQDQQEDQDDPGDDSDPDDDPDPTDGDPDPGTGDADGSAQDDDTREDVDPKEQELEERNQRANQPDSESEFGGTGDGSGENW